MTPPWQRGSGQEDMEALQTDVMRFMAILGLCLAAIFSLVKSPSYPTPATPAVAAAVPQKAQTADAAAQPASTASVPSAAGTDKAVSREVPPQVPASRQSQVLNNATAERQPMATQTTTEQSPAPAKPSDEATGFELVFASTDDLQQLLSRGGTALYATNGERFWRWQPGGSWSDVPPPASYYRMDTATLPRAFRRGIPPALAGAETTWGIDLPARTVQQIGERMRQHAGGLLVIDGRGGVSLGSESRGR